jgi:hypothetical protein
MNSLPSRQTLPRLATHDRYLGRRRVLRITVSPRSWVFARLATGCQGYTPEGATTQQPTKKPRGKELTPEQKAENRTISQERIGVEHSLGGIKIFHIVSSVFRNIKEGFDDLVMEVACGLFNFCRTCRSTA